MMTATKYSLTLAAIQHGKGEVDWYAATECALSGERDDFDRACDRAEGAADEDVRAKACDLLATDDPWELGFIEDDSRLVDRVNSVLREVASRIIQRQAQEIVDAEERAAQELDAAIANRKLECAEAIMDALAHKGGKHDACRLKFVSGGYGGFGSIYLRFRSLKLRISDHNEVPGGGFNVETGERNGASAHSWIINSAASGIPSREEIRSLVADLLKGEQ